MNNLFALNDWFLTGTSNCGSDEEEKLQTRAREMIIGVISWIYRRLRQDGGGGG